ncbi:MAG TPA: acyl-CoA dehydrogenase [Clostridiales bacterium]|nr:acyl-CoA dehydrogenase [Clostridiales bacterium]
MIMELSEQRRLFIKGFEGFARTTLEPIAFEDDRNARFPKEIIKKMADKNFFGLTIPSQYGGEEVDFVSVSDMAEALGYANGSAAAIAIAHLVMAEQTILKYGTENQKNKYLPDMVKGAKLGGYAYAEVGASLAAGENKVVAVKKGDAYTLTGKKTYVANGGAADVYVVIAQSSEADGLNGLSAFIVNASNIKVSKSIDKLGLRSFPTAELEFNNTTAELLGNEGEGLKIAGDIQARVDIAFGATAVGLGKKALEESVKHAKTRVQFGSPIAKLQAVQWMLAEMAEKTHILNKLTFDAAASVDDGEDYLENATYLKMYAQKAAFEIGTNAVQVHGGTGYSREANIERYFRDLRGLFNVENANEYPQKIIAGNLLK